jgi:mRNA interferase RelE/StbE
MSWKVEVKPTAEKYYLKLDKKMRKRVKKSLLELEKSENPLSHPQVRPLTGKLQGDYRLRVGDWRVLFTPDRDAKMLYVFAILPRGDAY